MPSAWEAEALPLDDTRQTGYERLALDASVSGDFQLNGMTSRGKTLAMISIAENINHQQ